MLRAFQNLPRWAQLLVSIAAAVGVIWSIVMYLNPIGAIELAVWVQQEVPIKVPVESPQLPLVLQYKGTPITRATVASATISNSGRTPIGGDKEPDQWVLTIKSKDGARIVPFADPEPKPSNLRFTVVETNAPDSVNFRFGLLNPGDSLGIRLLIINPENVEHPALIAQTRIANLREPIVTREPIESRVRSALLVPVWVVLSLALAVSLIWMDFKKDARRSWRALSVVVDSGLAVLVTFFPALGAAAGLAKVLLFQLTR